MPSLPIWHCTQCGDPMGDGDYRYQVNTALLCHDCYELFVRKTVAEAERKGIKADIVKKKLEAKVSAQYQKELEARVKELEEKLAEEKAVNADPIKAATKRWDKFFDG